jgi:hypothetical protein
VDSVHGTSAGGGARVGTREAPPSAILTGAVRAQVADDPLVGRLTVTDAVEQHFQRFVTPERAGPNGGEGGGLLKIENEGPGARINIIHLLVSRLCELL